MLRNRKTTGVTVIGSSSFMISNNSLKVHETLGVMPYDKENSVIKSTNIVENESSKTKVNNVTAIPPFAPSTIISQEVTTKTIITQQPVPSSKVNEGTLEYPADMTGFLNGLSEGLSNIVRDVKTSRFAADVKMDAKSIWKSTKGAVARLVIEPLSVSMDDEDGYNPSDSEETRRQKDYERADAATKVRMPSAWDNRGGNSTLNDNSLMCNDSGNMSVSFSGGMASKKRRSNEMGAKKLAKTPKGKSKQRNNDGNDKDSAKAELGSAIDLRKLSKAKKVQVFHGPGSSIMVVGARRLVVIEARPTLKEPHQGVVIWMSTLENVASIALEIQPSESNSEVSVALKVEVKQGEDHVFLMGVKDSTSLVQSIYARLNGETPPSLPKPPTTVYGTSDDTMANEAACQAASLNADGRGTSSSSMLPPSTPTQRSKGERSHGMKSSSKKRSSRKHKSHQKRDNSNQSNVFPCSSPNEKTNVSGHTYESPSNITSPMNGVEGKMLSPLRIMLSPTGRGKNMSLEITSISSPKGTLSMGPCLEQTSELDNDDDMEQTLKAEKSSSTPLKSLKTSFDKVSSPIKDLKKDVKDEKKQLEETLAKEDTMMPMKYRMMLKNGVPEMAVRNKLRAEMSHLKENEIDKLFAENIPLEASKPVVEETSTASSSLDLKQDETTALKENELTEEETSTAFKYKMMLKAGVPEAGVIQKMQQDDIDEKIIKFLCKSYQPTTEEKKKKEKVEMTADEEKQTRKYRVMLKAGVPSEAVQHKMKKDGIELKLSNLVLGIEENDDETDDKVEVLSEDEEKLVSKFKSMLKAGVPAMAVRHKMLKELNDMENNLKEKLINAVCGCETVDTGGGTEKWHGTDKSSSNKDDSKTPSTKPKAQSKLLTLHWTPLGISEEQLESSIWAQARPQVGDDTHQNGSNMQGKSGVHSHGTVLSPEMLKLELLFSKKPAKPSQTDKNGEGGDESGKNKQKKKKKQASCLDNTRRQNLSIALKNFKNLSPYEIGSLVSSLNVSSFTAEQLIRLQEMLPNNQEIKSVENHVKDMEKEMKKEEKQEEKEAAASGSESGDVSSTTPLKRKKTAIDCLEPAESFVLGFSKVERAQPKLAVLSQMRSLTTQVDQLLSDFNILGSACIQASTSTRLTSLLREVLAVGNIMNEGTEKGGAKGITVDSLLKLTNTRSVCKSMTVLDYIVDSLLSKQTKFNQQIKEENQLLNNNTTIEEDLLDDTPKPTPSEDELMESGKGPASILFFINELPQLNEACRLPLGELLQQVNSMKKNLMIAKREYEKMKTESLEKLSLQKNMKQKVINQSSKSTIGLKPSPIAEETSQSASDPRASLMLMLKQRAVEKDVKKNNDSNSIEESDAMLSGRNLTDSMRDEAEACQSVKELSDASGLRASAFLANDPKAGLMAALKARSANQSNEEETNNNTVIEEEKINDSDNEIDLEVNVVMKTVEALNQFIEYAEMKIQQVDESGISCKLAAENMTKFFGEPGTDAGHILSCLKQFSSMTLASKDQAIAKKLDLERRERIAAKEISNKSNLLLNTPNRSKDKHRDIDPKAGLMEEIRKAKEAKVQKS